MLNDLGSILYPFDLNNSRLSFNILRAFDPDKKSSLVLCVKVNLSNFITFNNFLNSSEFSGWGICIFPIYIASFSVSTNISAELLARISFPVAKKFKDSKIDSEVVGAISNKEAKVFDSIGPIS